MKRLNRIAALLLILLLALTAAGCSKEASESAAPTETAEEIGKPTEELTGTQASEKTAIELFFDTCSALSIESGKEIRVSSDVWQKEEIGESQVQYTSLGSTIVNTVLYDEEKERVLSVSSTLDIDSYADEELRASQIYNASVFAAAMTNGDVHTVSDFCSGFESVIESGIEMYQNDAKLSLEADETSVTMSAQAMTIYD